MPTKVLKDIESEHLDKYVDMMIRRCESNDIKEGICFRPNAKCYVSNKNLFLKQAIKVRVKYIARDEFYISETFYFDPKKYTWFLLNK